MKDRFSSRLNVFIVGLIASVLSLPAVAQNTVRISGTISDQENLPVVGAAVFVVGTDKYVTTNFEGAYEMTARPGDKVQVSFLGCRPIVFTVAENRVRYNFNLEPDQFTRLDAAVAIGYGESKVEDLTGSVAVVNMADIRGTTVMSVDNALQGRIAGADFMSTDGEPGATTSIRIRGTRSINASNEPLIIVDGVMDAINDLNDINPDDIESITVLRDASSVAIYGSLGSNGVILITTKGSEGKQGKTNVTFKARLGFNQLPAGLDIMNATEFAMYRNDMGYNGLDGYSDGVKRQTTPLSGYNFPDPYSLGEGTDWIKAVTRNAMYQQYMLTVSESKGKTSYYASFSYTDNQGIILNSGLQSITARLNLTHQLFKWLKLKYSGSYTWRYNENNKVTIGGSTYNGAQNIAPVLDIESTYNPYYGSSGSVFNNPYVRATQYTNDTERHTTNHSVTAELTPIKGLTIKSTFSYYLYQQHQYRYYPGTLPTHTEDEGGEAYRYESDNHNLKSETTVEYKFDKSGHNFSFLAGFSAYKYKSNSFSLDGKGYTDDDVMWKNMGAIRDKETLSPSTSYSTRQQMSVYARATWNYKKRYYLTATGRYDGASNFAANHKWGFFPSGAFKWRLNNESFMKNAGWINDLSLRLSVGISGNNAISNYQSLAVLSTSTSGWIFDGSQPANMYEGRLDSPDLRWEKTTMYNVGLDWSMLEDRLRITAEAYMSFTKDLLLSVETASQSGFTSRLRNLGKTSNKGLELTIESQNFLRPKFRWTTSFTISHNKQMVEDIGTEDFVSVYNSPADGKYMMYGYVKGYPLNALWGFKYAGTFKSEEEISANNVTKTYLSGGTSNLTCGNPRFMDVDHDGLLTNADLVYLGNIDPYVYGGLQNTFTIYGLSIGIYFAYSLGGKIYNVSETYMAGTHQGNQYRYMLNGWSVDRNPDSDIPTPGFRRGAAYPSSFMVHDASYIRLKTISVSYTFNLKQKWIRDITLSATGDNVFLWKYYNGFDPDISTSSSDSTLRRLDDGSYPKARTFIFSVQLRY